MPVVDYKAYCRMLDSANQNKYAYPAINVSNLETANAALAGFAEAKSDGIIQVSTGGGEHASGSKVKDMVLGAISLANHVHLMAEKYQVNIALHTDHCQPKKVDTFLKPLIAETEKRSAAGGKNLFNSHMFDGSELPLGENMKIAKELMVLCAKNEIILEVEAGVVGGEEDGHDTSGVSKDKLYTTPEDMLGVYEALNSVKGARYMFAATFGNVHGVYKPGNVKLKPVILKEGQDALKAKYGARFDLVFHGGSGSTKEEIHETLEYGVIKMNVDTDTQYAFSRPVADHVLKNYDGILKIDGEVGNKKVYDPRAFLKLGEKGMAARIVEACNDLRSSGKTLFAA
ncbi:MAG TPA: class II fructose-bisphosphate aldolase [Fibrobacteres bacterium]|jgi:fructose-bisphosphate aldolase class II|nr:class II fructose-bisphosphate aldolase [Fibrobacterota bacterium]